MDEKNFHQEIWEESLSRTRQAYNDKADRMKLILRVLFVVLAIIVLIGFGLWSRYEYIPGFMWGLFGADLLAILANAFFVPIMAYKNMWNVAAEIHNKQGVVILENKKKIEKLQQELKKELVDVELDIYEWGFYEPNVTPLSEMVCVVVKNLGNEDIRCYGALTLLIRVNSDHSTNNLLGEAIRNGSLISWSGGGVNDEQEVLIKAGHERILNIANGIDGNLIFKLQNLNFTQNQNGTYAFDVEIGGHVAGKKIVNKTECFYIDYDKQYKTYSGGEERPFSDSDEVNKISDITGYDQFGPASFRKLDIRKRNCKDDEQKTI